MTTNNRNDSSINSLSIGDLPTHQNSKQCNSLEYSSDDLGSLPISPVSENESSSSETVDARENPLEKIVATNQTSSDKSESHRDSDSGANENQSEDETENELQLVNTLVTLSPNGSEKSEVPTEISSRHWHMYSDCNKRNDTGQSPLSLSSANCFLKGMVLLLEKGADVNLVDVYGRSPLHLACENAEAEDHHKCVEFLLKNGADTHITDVFGRTPLHIAAKEGCVECIRTLLDYGARTDAKDEVGDTALHITASMGHFDCMCALSPECCDDSRSHSSVESVSASIFDQENPNSFFSFSDTSGRTNENGGHVAGSFYHSPRDFPIKSSFRRHNANQSEVVRIDSDLGNTLRQSAKIHNNDSGYFSAKSNGAWTKSKYYDNYPIHEENKSVESGSKGSSAPPKYEMVMAVKYKNKDVSQETIHADKESKTLLSGLFGFIFGLIKYGLQISFWGQQSVTDSHDYRTIKPAGMKFKFVEPPDHVADAMERWKQSEQYKRQMHPRNY